MPDFEEIARRLREDSERRRRECAEGRSEGGGEPLEEQGQAIEYLSNLVVPLLQEAKAALAKTGVVSTIETSWTSELPVCEPTVTFYCGERGVDAGVSLPIGDVVEFSAAGDMLKVTDAASGQRLLSGTADVERAIEGAIHHAVTTYYRELEDSVR